MKSVSTKILNKSFGLLLAGSFLMMGCNKALPDAVPIPRQTDETTPTLATFLDVPEFSILKSAVNKAGFMANLSNPANRFTLFAPDNAAFIGSGIPQAAIDALPVATVTAIVSYHVVPQLVNATSIPTSFPNLQYPSSLNPAPTLSALLRLTTFPSKRGSNIWVNNIPVIAAEQIAKNGIIHKVARVVAPPSMDLWANINSNPQLTYYKATIQRADSESPAGTRLQDALNTAVNPSAIASNLTVFAPSDDAMKMFLTGALTQAFVSAGIPLVQAQGAATFLVTTFGSQIISNPASIPDVPGFPPMLGARLAAVITPTLAKGIAVYHIVSAQSGTYLPPGIRLFSVNLPTSATGIKTLLNSAVAPHPGIAVQATFGVAGVTSITVKGAANATASNVQINPLPSGTSDQHFVNGVLHVIDQVLLPQ